LDGLPLKLVFGQHIFGGKSGNLNKD
jgi:hypothetical protein